MSNKHLIHPGLLSLDQVSEMTRGKYSLALSEESIQQIEKCRTYLDNKLAKGDHLIYGINTGFGSLCNVKISDQEIETLQENLVKSHACGLGDEVPPEVVRLILFFKIQSLAYGHSAAQLQTVQRLVDFYNHDILPVIYQQGSLGASGDLAPLAHLSLPLLGYGEVYFKGEKVKTTEVYDQLGWKPLQLKSKEGLALLNGTQFSLAYLCYTVLKSYELLSLANLSAAISLDAFDCRLSPFNDKLHQIRPHRGQVETARLIRELLEGSQIAAAPKESVQDPYSFRCVPQVHGASQDTIEYVSGVLQTEMNAVTDNPNIFPEEDEILSGGNFHAQPLAFALDFLAIAVSELGSISERRTFQLISGVRGLPAFLILQAGLNSGLMIPQYTAASIVSQNKQFCTPASVDSIVSSNGQEDHVSMAANAATKAYKVVENVERVIAIEFMTAAQAMEFRRPLRSSPIIESVLEKYRKQVPALENDRILYEDIKKTIVFLSSLILEV
ncbi:MAG: histidine ammonia-lyase [Saprospiraceae bacterium]|jgi:histidine ammonia-lyase